MPIRSSSGSSRCTPTTCFLWMIVYSCSASSRMYGSLIHSRMSGMSPSHADGLPLLKPRRPLCARARFPEPSVVEASGARSGGSDRLCSQCRFCVLACLPCRLRGACSHPHHQSPRVQSRRGSLAYHQHVPRGRPVGRGSRKESAKELICHHAVILLPPAAFC